MIGLSRTSIADRPHWVLFQNPGPDVSDGDGGSTHAWFELTPPGAFVSIAPATASDLERIAAGTVLSTNTHIVKGPYHPQVTTATRIIFGTRVFNVTGGGSPQERHVEMELVAVELLDEPPVDLTIDGGAPDSIFAGVGFDGGGV